MNFGEALEALKKGEQYKEGDGMVKECLLLSKFLLK